jgi:hypothetical protein
VHSLGGHPTIPVPLHICPMSQHRLSSHLQVLATALAFGLVFFSSLLVVNPSFVRPSIHWPESLETSMAVDADTYHSVRT